MPVVKILEVVGSSTKDWNDAVSQAVKEASPGWAIWSASRF